MMPDDDANEVSYPANKFNKLQESRRPDKRSASGDFAFVIRLNPGMIARISIKISDHFSDR